MTFTLGSRFPNLSCGQRRKTKRAIVLYRLTATYAKILKMFRFVRSLTPLYLVSQLFPKLGVWNAPIRVLFVQNALVASAV